MADILPLRALVTGATSGIGRAVAVKLATDGFEVLVHGRDAERGAQTVKEIERSGGKARFLAADLGNPAEIRRLAEQAGDIDVLVNNAGFSAWGPTADLDVATFDGMFAARVNAVAPGPVYTRPAARKLFDTLGATTPLNRAAEPAEIAEVVAFLASSRASYVTGAVVAVDGDRTAI